MLAINAGKHDPVMSYLPAGCGLSCALASRNDCLCNGMDYSFYEEFIFTLMGSDFPGCCCQHNGKIGLLIEQLDQSANKQWEANQ